MALKDLKGKSYKNTVTGRTCKIISATNIYVRFEDDLGYCRQLTGAFLANIEAKKYIMLEV